MHRVFWQASIPQPGRALVVTGEEAGHARVKRLEPGERIELLDGQGRVAHATVTRFAGGKRDPQLELQIQAVHSTARPTPLLHVRSATPKGDRLDTMIEQLAQVGVASWGPLHTIRGIVDPRETKLERLERIVIAASKQCGAAHMLRIGVKAGIDELAGMAGSGRLVVAAAGGAPWTSGPDDEVVLAIGPEGDWTEEELAQMRAAGARVCNFGPHVMRIETAAVAASAIIMSHATVPPRR